ncbi:hypothetical protein [Pseudonocardia humida]|uniref:Uncharacterized protein n=1 Tax=Pseudonocardia humida TaxID=2800819 RepID=A0ABT1A3N0_9PSEU|nr:hypothetical protein [Pseudonocardia humida]MCO1657616.1 hypothetical protein [Pseudonocardia humida]
MSSTVEETPRGALVRFRGGPLDGRVQRFEYLVHADGRPHERLARRDGGGRHVYLVSAGPLEDGSWEFAFAGSRPRPIG